MKGNVSCSETDQIACKNGGCADSTQRCIYGYDVVGFPLGCRDATHLLDCGKLTIHRLV